VRTTVAFTVGDGQPVVGADHVGDDELPPALVRDTDDQ
jgi:hypothetical protein